MNTWDPGSTRPTIDPDHHPLRLSQRPGYGRPVPTHSRVSQVVWGLLGLASLGFWANPSHMILGLFCPLIALASIAWIEWSNRCEDQARVNRVFAVIMVLLALLAASSRRDHQ